MNIIFRKGKIILIVALTLGLSSLMTGCQQTSTIDVSTLPTQTIEPVKRQIGDVTLMVDPRIELLAAVQQQANYKVLNQLNTQYWRDTKAYFKPYKNTSAVTLFKNMFPRGFSYDAPPHALLHYSMPDALTKHTPLKADITERAGGEKALTSFVNELSGFSKQTHFKAFFDAHRPLYQQQVDDVADIIDSGGLTEILDDYYGMPHGDYNIILSLNGHSGGFGPSMTNKEGQMDVYGIIGPGKKNGELPVYEEDFIEYIILHEFSHSFVNPLTTAHPDQVKSLSSLFEPIQQQMSNRAYPEWEICLNEHLIRAINARMLLKTHGELEAEAQLKEERDAGFIYIDTLYEALSTYDNNRDQYPTFDAFYPALLKSLERHKAL